MKLVFIIVVVGWIGQLKLLMWRPVMILQNGSSRKDFFDVFETLVYPFSSEDFKKIICCGFYSPAVGFRHYLCNCNQRELHYIHFPGFFSKFSLQLFQNTFMKSSVTKS